MSPNPADPSYNIESVPDISKNGLTLPGPGSLSSGRYLLVLTQGSLNLVAYLLIGIVVGINLQFAYRFGTNLNPVNVHIVLCVLGYQALMGVGILILAPESGFSGVVSLKHKRWIHSFLLFAGSILALAGSFIMSLAKSANFDTIHGKTSLPATICTIICFFNGVASLYAYEFRKCLPGTFSKLTHILSGIVAFTMATVCLCYGFHKTSFRNWSTHEFVTVLFVFTAIFTAICILNPFITFFTKLGNSIKSD